ncbi:hypothetical protein L210DRAFT_3511087 [Boletus edulis BED1]|uniref:CxC2-like cysteine cluster KDZ transposase-associated domain-containing protein n=1 Tax=Boletus edulis BED1 TaxID=1328754 RepID=A0AAD4G6H1_BOLED|nr:hypothetical protein L210DRAFT_3511087 [Boletus edulis BED1]
MSSPESFEPRSVPPQSLTQSLQTLPPEPSQDYKDAPRSGMSIGEFLSAKCYEIPPMAGCVKWSGFTPPTDMCAPVHHAYMSYQETVFVLPESSKGKHFYAVTRGILVCVFLNWTTAATYVVKVWRIWLYCGYIQYVNHPWMELTQTHIRLVVIRLYHTPLERLLAARASCAKYYHRARISATQESLLENILGHSLYTVMDSLCLDYIATKDYGRINEIHSSLSKVAAALSVAGTNGLDNKFQNLKTCIQTALQVLENLLLPAMEGLDIPAMRQHRALLYQSLVGNGILGKTWSRNGHLASNCYDSFKKLASLFSATEAPSILGIELTDHPHQLGCPQGVGWMRSPQGSALDSVNVKIGLTWLGQGIEELKKPRLTKFKSQIEEDKVDRFRAYQSHDGQISLESTFLNAQLATIVEESTSSAEALDSNFQEAADIEVDISDNICAAPCNNQDQRKKQTPGANPLLQWLPERRSVYLDELIRLEGQSAVRYIESSLKSLGLRIQLGHTPGMINVNGIHEVNLDFCGCESAQSHYKQLLRSRWFPATTCDPRTAATFAVLKLFHLLSLDSKASAYEFYSSLSCLTDNLGLQETQDRYPAFMRMMHEYRHLKQLQRAGRGHITNGIENTRQGECAVRCPACPHPGINLLNDWEVKEPAKGWIYALFITIDANFILKQKTVSSELVDPSLNRGWAYFVEKQSYKNYLKDHAKVSQEKSFCVSHNAVNMADSKLSRGRVDCAWHEMKLPCGVGDLQKGESVVVLIDQLWSRMSALPEPLHLNHDTKIAHIQACQTMFSFNFTCWMGRIDGEAPERGWANFNRVASSTKEMGPGFHRDHLDDHFGDSNWKKRMALGQTLFRKMMEAVPSAETHRRELEELERTIDPTELLTWHLEYKEWEEDKLRLAEEEADELKRRTDVSLHDDISPFILVSSGLDLQELQHQLATDVLELGMHAMDHQRANIAACHNVLQRKLESWMQVQLLYMPAVSTLRMKGYQTTNDDDPSTSNRPEKVNLFLLSNLGAATPCDQRLQRIEWELRYAQANNALNEVHRSIQLYAHLSMLKTTNIQGQKANTRARSALDFAAKKKQQAKVKYMTAREALLVLGPLLGKVDWDTLLHDTDMRYMSDMLDGQTEETRDLSSIWKMPGILQSSEKGLQNMKEEMRRTLAFLEWEKVQWMQRADARVFENVVDQEGSAAYAKRQAALRKSTAAATISLWSTLPAELSAHGERNDG